MCFQVQFGHAGACAHQTSETAVAKNMALHEAGAYVPRSFDELGDVIRSEIIRSQEQMAFWKPNTILNSDIIIEVCVRFVF